MLGRSSTGSSAGSSARYSAAIALPLTTLVALAEEGSEHALNPWWVGVATLGILLLAIGALLAFGGGREHS